MGDSALLWFVALTDWYPENARLQRLSEVVSCLLVHDQQSRPSASALLEAVWGINPKA